MQNPRFEFDAFSIHIFPFLRSLPWILIVIIIYVKEQTNLFQSIPNIAATIVIMILLILFNFTVRITLLILQSRRSILEVLTRMGFIKTLFLLCAYGAFFSLTNQYEKMKSTLLGTSIVDLIVDMDDRLGDFEETNEITQNRRMCMLPFF